MGLHVKLDKRTAVAQRKQMKLKSKEVPLVKGCCSKPRRLAFLWFESERGVGLKLLGFLDDGKSGLIEVRRMVLGVLSSKTSVQGRGG